MSKSLKVKISKRVSDNIKSFVKKIHAASQIRPGPIPAVGLIPSVSNSIPPLLPIPIHTTQREAVGNSIVSNLKDTSLLEKKAIQETTIENSLTEKQDALPDLITMLENSGCVIEEIKPLPSGERRITVSDILGNSTESKEYEYAYRS